MNTIVVHQSPKSLNTDYENSSLVTLREFAVQAKKEEDRLHWAAALCVIYLAKKG